MNDMREIDVEMHMRYGAFSSDKEHGIALDKAFHQVFGPFEIFRDPGSMLEDIEQENAPFGRSLPYHVDIIAEVHIVVRGIDRRIGVAFYIIVDAYFHIAYDGFEIIPVPLVIGRPLPGHPGDHQGLHGVIVLIFEVFSTDSWDSVYRLQLHASNFRKVNTKSMLRKCC